jgi:hypothetical protein
MSPPATASPRPTITATGESKAKKAKHETQEGREQNKTKRRPVGDLKEIGI